MAGWHNPPIPWSEFERTLREGNRPGSSPPLGGDAGDSPAWSHKRGAYQRQGIEPPDPATVVPYAELHAHSSFSFLDGASSPEELLEEAGLDELIGPAGYTSGAGVMSTLTNKPTHVSVIDELGRQLKAAAAKGMQHKADALTSIMERFGRQDGTLRQQGYATNTMKSSEA